MLKILQARLQQYVNRELSDVQAEFRKGRGTRDQIANIHWITEKAREFQKNIYFCFIDYAIAFDSCHVWMWEFDNRESWALKNWCFWTVVLEKTLESLLDCKEIQSVNPQGNQSWIFIGRTDVEAETPIFWPLDAKNWLIGKDPDADWRLKVGGEGDERGWDG